MILSTQQLYIDSRSGTTERQDAISLNMALSAPEGAEMRLFLTEFTCPQALIQMDNVFNGKGMYEIYVRTNAANSNRESAALTGSNIQSSELYSSDILAKIHVYKGNTNVQYYASTERESMMVVTASQIGSMDIYLTDHLGNRLHKPVPGFAAGTFDKGGDGYFSATLRLDIVKVRNIEHLDIKEGYNQPPREATAVIPSFV